MNLFQYVLPAAEELVILDPVDRIADIAHSCHLISPKDHASNVAFVKDLCAEGHMGMLEHGFLHFRFPLRDFRHLLSLSKETHGIEVGYEYSKHFSFATDAFDAYLTVSLRLLSDALASIWRTEHLSEKEEIFFGAIEGQSYKFLLIHMVDHLPREAKEVVLARFSQGDEIEGYLQTNDPSLSPLFSLLKEEEIRALPKSIRTSQQHLVYRLTTDRGTTHELVRHRGCSFAQESTRRCDYSSKRLGKILTILKPHDYELRSSCYDEAFENSARSYFSLLAKGALPEEARAVLPNSLKASLTVTASLGQWEDVFRQRLAPDAHPSAKTVVNLVKEDMAQKGYLS